MNNNLKKWGKKSITIRGMFLGALTVFIIHVISYSFLKTINIEPSATSMILGAFVVTGVFFFAHSMEDLYE